MNAGGRRRRTRGGFPGRSRRRPADRAGKRVRPRGGTGEAAGRSSSRDRIIEAAIQVFAEDGKHGARMEEIGARARVNKAMVYYYYSSKKNLFREALVVTLRRIFGRIFAAFDRGLERGTDPRRKIEAAVSAHFDAFSRNPHGARLFFAAIADDPEDVRFALTIIRRESDVFPPEKLLSILEEGMRQGAFRKVDPKQTLISLVGMNLAYFVGGPIAKAVLDLRITNEEAFQAERKRSILDLFLNGLAAKGRPS